MPPYSWLLGSLLVGQLGGIPSAALTVAPPTTNSSANDQQPANRPTTAPRIPAVPAATYPASPSTGGALVREPAGLPAGKAAVPARVVPPAAGPRATPAQLVTDALTLPPGSTISGQAVSLLSVVATAPQRERQTEAVHAYWRLTEALGEYHFSHERQQRLARLQAGNDEAADLRTARAIAAAQIGEAELQVTTAQHDLAGILLLAPGTPLPLPADPPLLGPYRTLFAELFAGKKAPEHVRMLDQTLPLRNRAVESHAAALLAAEDALDAAIELQTSGQGRLAGVIAALDAQVRQQRAFLAAVCRYNHDIADYALAVVSPQTSPERLVGTLIKLARPAGQPVAPLPTTTTLPATFQQPAMAPTAPTAPASGNAGVPPTGRNWAVQPGVVAGRAPGTANAVRAEEAAPSDSPAVVAPPDQSRSNDSDGLQLAPPQESAIPLVPETPPANTKSPEGPTTRSTHKPISADGPPQASPLETESGPTTTMAAWPPAERAVKLTAALYRDQSLREPWGVGRGPGSEKLTAALYQNQGLPLLAGQPVRLIDCLRTAPVSGRAKVVEAYWNARQTAAQNQSLVEQIQWLTALGPTLSAQNPPSPMGMLNYRTARLAVEAERADADADTIAARFELADLAGLGTEKILPQPDCVPFVGRLPLSALSSDRPWPQRRLEATIPQRQQTIVSQAAVVVEADASRAAAAADFLGGRSPVERVLAAVEVQARETCAFLRSVTEYNRAIAQYATATLPANTEAQKLVAALMVE